MTITDERNIQKGLKGCRKYIMTFGQSPEAAESMRLDIVEAYLWTMGTHYALIREQSAEMRAHPPPVLRALLAA